MKPFHLLKEKLLLAALLVQKGALNRAEMILSRIEEMKIYFKTSDLEQKIEIDIALLGEKTFNAGGKDFSLLIQDPSVSLLTSKILEDQRRLSEIKNK